MKDLNDVLRAGIDLGEYVDSAKPYKPKGNGAGNHNEQKRADTSSDAQNAGAPVPSLKEWLGRKIAPRDLLCGTFLSTTCRIIITGPTGLGKTMLGIALMIALAAGGGFLHWKGRRPARILYIDGEMSRELMQERLIEECQRAGVEPDNCFILSKEDFEDMPPLNTEAGQKWMDAKIEEIGPEMIIFDNIQALIVGDHGKEESWSPVLPWVSSLTKQCIGQIWFHHTGHNEGHSYGTKTREWKMDTCILMERVPDAEDLTFTLRFTKARARRPDNREDYADVTISLVNDRWEVGDVAKKKAGKEKGLSDAAKIALKQLRKLVTEAGETPPASNHIPSNVRVVQESLWRKYCYEGGITASEELEAKKKAFQRACESLLSREMIGKWQDSVWLV